MSGIHKEAVTAKCATVLLLLVPICPEGHLLSLAIYGVKMTEQAHVWLPTVWQMANQVFMGHTAWAVHRLSLAVYGVKMTEQAHVWLPAVCWQIVKQVFIDHTAWVVFTKRPLL
jgi:hypothetical protein